MRHSFRRGQLSRPRPSTAATTMATATAAATDFLTATGFRFRPPGERASERRRFSRFTETISVSIAFVCPDRPTDRPTDRQGDSVHIHAICVVKIKFKIRLYICSQRSVFLSPTLLQILLEPSEFRPPLSLARNRHSATTAPGFALFIFSFLARPPSLSSSSINKRLSALLLLLLLRLAGVPNFRDPILKSEFNVRCAELRKMIG